MKSKAADTSRPLSSIVILCTPCFKGSQGLRAGAHLVNHGVAVTAFIPPSDTDFSPSFEFHLRLFSAAGGIVVRSIDSLPEKTDLVLDALMDSGTSAKRSKHNAIVAESVTWALSCTPFGKNARSPIYSIDSPSNTDIDTGAPVSGATWSITPSAVVSLGLVKLSSINAGYTLFLADIGLPSVSYSPALNVASPDRVDFAYRLSLSEQD